jgi:hypothetical protein
MTAGNAFALLGARLLSRNESTAGPYPVAFRVIPVFIVHHTHWDREWYDPAHTFRRRLIPLVDHLVDALEASPELGPFLLDGQLAVVDDYLSVRPERRDRIARLVRAGRLLLGPWYVLADELLSSDEALVRNLLEGRARANALGGWLALGYSPDAFGHPSALPTILAGFGIRHAVLWRGYGGEAGQANDLFRWRGPDGSSLLTYHLPPDGYEFGMALVGDELRADGWGRVRETLSRRAGAPALMVFVGADHHAPAMNLRAIVDELEVLDRSHQFEIASPLQYFASLGDDLRIPTVSGELRFSYRYTWTLQGIHSTRSRLKRRLADGAALITRWAEPQVALSGTTQRDADVALTWRDHLLSCAHDSLGGCCADEVAADIEHRAGRVAASSRELFIEAVKERVGFDATVSRRRRDDWSPAMVLVNPTPAPRRGVVEATLAFFVDDVPVGMTNARLAGAARRRLRRSHPPPAVYNARGEPLPVQVLGDYLGYDRLDSPTHYPDQDVVRAVRVAMQVGDVPALGLTRLDVSTGAEAVTVRDPVGARLDRLESSWCTVRGAGVRSFAVDVPSAGWRLRGVAQIESERDGGDTYTFQPIDGDRPKRPTWGRARVLWRGPLVACLARAFEIPGVAAGTVFVKLMSEDRVVRIIVEGRNLGTNHRLRLMVPTPGGRAGGTTVADMHFGPVRREREAHDRADYPLEWPVTTAPMHRYVSVPGRGGHGITVLSRGAFEYELLPDGRIGVTLLRAVGELSRGDLPARPGHAGWPAATPSAQEPGAFRVELGLIPLGPDVDAAPEKWGELEREAEAFHAPLAGVMIRQALDLPDRITGPVLEGDGLVFKCLKRACDGEGLIFRCANITGAAVVGALVWPRVPRDAVRVDLAETPDPQRSVRRDGNRVAFEAAPREVVTILVRP